MSSVSLIQLPLFALEKRCPRCATVKPVSAFSPSKRRDGCATYCRPCYQAWRRERSRPAPPTEKACAACEVVHPIAQFSRSLSTRDGYHTSCKACRHDVWIAMRRDADLARLRAKNATLTGEERAHRRANDRAKRQRKPEQYAAYHHKWYRAHRDEQLARSKAWMKARPDKWIPIRKASNYRWRARRAKAEGVVTHADELRIYASQNGLCAYCARPLNGIYDADHIIPLSRGGSNWPENICCACERCNSSKNAKTAEEYRAYRERCGL